LLGSLQEELGVKIFGLLTDEMGTGMDIAVAMYRTPQQQ
jgi:hypothetical protein